MQRQHWLRSGLDADGAGCAWMETRLAVGLLQDGAVEPVGDAAGSTRSVGHSTDVRPGVAELPTDGPARASLSGRPGGVGRRTTFATKASAGQLPAGCIEQVLAEVEFPIQLIYGADDIYGELVAGPRKRLPRATFEVWPGVGHLPWLDDPERFRASLLGFFALPD